MEKNIINIDAHVIDDIRTIITRARNRAYQSINETLIGRFCTRACKILLGPI